MEELSQTAQSISIAVMVAMAFLALVVGVVGFAFTALATSYKRILGILGMCGGIALLIGFMSIDPPNTRYVLNFKTQDGALHVNLDKYKRLEEDSPVFIPEKNYKIYQQKNKLEKILQQLKDADKVDTEFYVRTNSLYQRVSEAIHAIELRHQKKQLAQLENDLADADQFVKNLDK